MNETIKLMAGYYRYYRFVLFSTASRLIVNKLVKVTFKLLPAAVRYYDSCTIEHTSIETDPQHAVQCPDVQLSNTSSGSTT